MQYSGEPKVSGVISWKSLLEIGRGESDDVLNDRLKRIAVNQCCLLVYTSGTTGPPKVTLAEPFNLMTYGFIYSYRVSCCPMTI